jgi:macrolide-specific efflux system membrane fusion protein
MKIPKNKLIRYLVIFLLLVLAGILIKFTFFTTDDAPSYLTATATVAEIEDTVLASGTVKASKLVVVGAQASGQIKALKVALGDHLKKGQLIAEIDAMTQENALRTAESELAHSRAQLRAKQATLKQAELAYARQQKMLAQDASSREDHEKAEAALNVAQADITALKTQIDKGRISVNTERLKLGYTKITAPMDGVVVAVVAEEGQTVNANQNTPAIVKLAQMDSVTVKAQISEADVTRVKPGQKVYFTILGEPEKRYHTSLRAVEPAPDSILRDETVNPPSPGTSNASAIYYNGLFDMPNPDGKLRIAMTTQVHIILKQVKQAIVIPATALGQRESDQLYTIQVLDQKGKAQTRKVRTGINNNATVEILEGLNAGEKVVIGSGDSASMTVMMM